MRIFINYRRRDAGAYPRLLHDGLAARYRAEDVFLDVVDLEPGMDFLREITTQGATSAVLLALIGRDWLAELRERAQAALNDAAEDMVKREIEAALTRGSEVTLIPVLIDGATMPDPQQLPRSLRPLAYLQAAPLRHTEFEHDIESLIQRLEQFDVNAKPAQAATLPEATATVGPTLVARSPPTVTIDPDDAAHYDAVLNFLVGPRSIVPILGPEVNTVRQVDPGSTAEELRGSHRLAAEIARTFGLELAPGELARVAQEVLVTAGAPDLNVALRRLVEAESEPSPVHRFLAQIPRRLAEAGWPRRHQMIVTTNYNVALERAFDAEQEPYDLAVYMVTGDDHGRFVHFPFDRQPEPIAVPNRYGKLPIDDDGELQRTLIVKVQGAVDGTSNGYRWRENFVVAEDHFIDYLSHNSIASLVPIQILDKLTSSHCLFLGYPLAGWSHRVLLKRIWQAGRITSRSWAVEEAPEQLESDFWRHFDVDLRARNLDDYVAGLSTCLEARLSTAA